MQHNCASQDPKRGTFGLFDHATLFASFEKKDTTMPTAVDLYPSQTNHRLRT